MKVLAEEAIWGFCWAPYTTSWLSSCLEDVTPPICSQAIFFLRFTSILGGRLKSVPRNMWPDAYTIQLCFFPAHILVCVCLVSFLNSFNCALFICSYFFLISIRIAPSFLLWLFTCRKAHIRKCFSPKSPSYDVSHVSICEIQPYFNKLHYVLAVVQLVSHVWLCELQELQHARLPCPSPSSRLCSNSGPLSWWCHPTVLSSVDPFSSCLQSFPALGSFPMIRLFAAEYWPKYWSFSFSINPSNEYSGLISFRIDSFDFLAVRGSLKSLFQHYSSKASVLWCSAFFMFQHSHPYMTTRKKS